MNEWMFVSTPGSRRWGYASINSYYITLCPRLRAKVNKSPLSHLPKSLPLRFRPCRWTGLCSPSTPRCILPLWVSVSSCVTWRTLSQDLQLMTCRSALYVPCKCFNLFSFIFNVILSPFREGMSSQVWLKPCHSLSSTLHLSFIYILFLGVEGVRLWY